VNVNGADAHPVYRFLRLRTTTEPIPWNFTMFLVSRSGTAVRRFDASRTPQSITAEIEELLGTSNPYEPQSQ
jgi:glutathione peroxidase